MPAPAALAIQASLTQALLNKGFYKQTYDPSGALQVDKTALPDALQKLVEAWATGDADWFATWQATQTTLVPGVVSGPSTAIGTLP